MKERKIKNENTPAPELQEPVPSVQKEKSPDVREKAQERSFASREEKDAPVCRPSGEDIGRNPHAGQVSQTAGISASGENAQQRIPSGNASAEEPESSEPADTECRSRPKNFRILTGRLMVALGILLILSAGGLFLRNKLEDRRAGEASAQMLPQVQQAIINQVKLAEEQDPTIPEHVNPYNQAEVEKSNEMTVWTHNSWSYIGYLHIPSLELELPVLSELSQYNLGMAPCRHLGSTKSDDLVLAAHNYSFHFGRIRELAPGDEVSFVDMDGVLSDYQVVTVSVISPMDIDLVTDPSLDLTLYTCTYGGQDRVMVGCQRIREGS